MPGRIHIRTLRWDSFSFASNENLSLTASYLDQHGIDIVVGDPLATLGIKGAGSLEDTREFLHNLKRLGLNNNRTFLFLHHFRKGGGEDEMEALQGAWGGHLDTLMVLKNRRNAETRSD